MVSTPHANFCGDAFVLMFQPIKLSSPVFWLSWLAPLAQKIGDTLLK
jgi:hypothetical protein